MNLLPGSTFVAQDRPCPYLRDRRSSTLYRYGGVDARIYEALVMRGWRRFGYLFFAPVCSGCEQCYSLRVDTARFHPSRSLKRVWQKNRDTELIVRRPTISSDHLDLYNRYHQERKNARGWHHEPSGPAEYLQAFVEGGRDFGYEFAYFREGQLVAVALVDLLPRALSAVYCYYDPLYKPYSLGTYSILKQIAYAKEHNIPHLYPGYWVPQNQSLSYKSRFRPFEVLQGRPTLDDEAIWLAANPTNF